VKNTVKNRLRPLVLLSAAMGLAGVSVARADGPTQQELLDKINELQKEVQQLKAQVDSHNPTPKPATAPDEASQVNATAQAVAADAEQRTQLFQLESLNAGWSRGRFLLQSSDGRYLLHPWFQIQARSVTTWREDAKQKGTGDDTQNGFEIRRLKFGFDGNVITPDLTYMLQFAVDRKTGNTQLEMAWARYHFPDTPFSIRGGQFKEALDHEQLLASKFFVAADRTLVDDLFLNSEGFVQGAGLIYDNAGALRGEVDFTDGMKSGNTGFQDFPTSGISSDWGANGRAEYKLLGDWSDYDKFAALDTKKYLLVAGGGADWTEAGHSAALVHVADLQFFSPHGLGLYAAYLGRYTRGNAFAKFTGDTYDWTARAQASYAFGRRWEPFVQYEYINFDHNTVAAGVKDEIHAIRGGFSYYIFGHNAKITVDATYLPNGSPVSDDGNGVLQNNNHNEIVGRAQFQLLI
jgi:hypothetical protein